MRGLGGGWAQVTRKPSCTGRGHVVVSELHEFHCPYRANVLYFEKKLLIAWEVR